MTPARTSAAMDSQTLGANSTNVGAISRKSFIMVSGCSTKLIFIRHSSPLPSTYTCSMIQGSGKTETYSSSGPFGSNAR